MESNYTAAEVEARFKSVKGEHNWSILKIYDDGAIKVVDNLGHFFFYDSHDDFMKKTVKHVSRPAIRK